MATVPALRVLIACWLTVTALAPATTAVAQLATEPSFTPQIETVLKRFESLVEADRAAAEAGAPIADATANNLRRAVQRLTLKARSEGWEMRFVAERLQDAADERFGDAIPRAFQNEEGRLDAAALIRGVIGRNRTTGVRQADQAYLSQISAEGAETRVETRKNSAPPSNVVARALENPAAPEPAAADIAADEPNPASTELKARVRETDGQRFITVAPGDTLGRIAAAVYGDVLQFRVVFEANRSVLADPNILPVGTQIRLP